MISSAKNAPADAFAAFLDQDLSTKLLRFTTAGSVDDGKSTLIGRLLHDSKAVYEDQLASVKRSRINRSTGPIDFSLITDGLRAEREQGITIDVAYRYFATSRRKFIIADTPGHEQYTRNMATGASTANLAVILIDATKGLLAQTRRHAFIASVLEIKHVLAAVNKMDLAEYREDLFLKLKDDFVILAAQRYMQHDRTSGIRRLDSPDAGIDQPGQAIGMADAAFRPDHGGGHVRRSFRCGPLSTGRHLGSELRRWVRGHHSRSVGFQLGGRARSEQTSTIISNGTKK